MGSVGNREQGIGNRTRKGQAPAEPRYAEMSWGARRLTGESWKLAYGSVTSHHCLIFSRLIVRWSGSSENTSRVIRPS